MDGTQSLGKYQLLRRLSVGGMGEVFIGRQQGAAGFDRLVAIKKILPELAERPEIVTMFIDEARISAHLGHPNIVQIHDFGREAGSFFLVMEYVPGQNLSRICGRAKRAGVSLPLPVAVHIVAEVARALEFAHQARDSDGKPLRIVHRDVSPQNVLISFQGDVKLMDFGVAKAAIRLARTETGVVRGKFSYMSPEQVEGGQVDARTDVFAAGILLWELTLARRLFDGQNAVEALRQLREEQIVAPRAIEPDYPEALEQVVMGALQRDVERRIPSAGQLQSSLRAFLATTEPVEKESIGALVRELFPENQKNADELSHGEATAVDSIASTKVLPGTRITAGDLPDQKRGPDTHSSPSTDEARDSQAVAPARRHWLAVTILGLAVTSAAAIAGGVWLAGTKPRLEEEKETTSSPAEMAGARHQTATAHRRDLSSDSVVERSADAMPAFRPATRRHRKAAQARPKKRRKSVIGKRDRSKKRKPVAPLQTRPEKPGADPGKKDAKPEGTLIVSSRPWGMVTINGKGYGETDLQVKVSPGSYTVNVDVSGGGGSYSTRAVVLADKKTKCRVLDKSISCQRPR